MQTVEHGDDRLPQGGASYNGIVDYHKVVDVVVYATVGDVVDMGGKIVA